MPLCTKNHRRPAVLAGAALLALALGAGADTTMTTIPLAPHGDAGRGSSGHPTALSPTTFLVPSIGADGRRGTGDDVMLLVTGVGGTPVATALDTPFLSGWSGRTCRLSATSALVFGSGPDDSWGTADDAVHVLSGLGSSNTVTPVTVGGLDDYGGGAPVRLSAGTAVMSTIGPDRSEGTDDDEIVLLLDLDAAPRIVRSPAPHLDLSYISRPIALSPTTFLIGSEGPDQDTGTDDDVTFLFTVTGDTVVRTDLPTPVLMDGAPGRATRVHASRAVVGSAGPDGNDGTADDQLYLLDALGGANTITPIDVGATHDYSAGLAVALADDLVVFCSEGPDEDDRTADDGLTVVSGLGTTNAVTLVTLGAIDEDRECRPLRLSANSCAVVTSGPDSSFEGSDDTIAVVTDVGGTNDVMHTTVPGLASGSTSTPVVVGATSLLIRCGGADADIGGNDDVVAFVSNLGTTADVEHTPTGPSPTSTSDATQVPVVLGDGRAVFVAAGPDGSTGNGGDDEIRVISGLPQPRSLTLKKVWIKFKPAKLHKGTVFSVKGTLALDTPDLFATDDVTVSIGNASQTIPASAFTTNKKGTIFKYKDKKRLNGFVKSLVYDAKKSKLTIAGKGVGTGGETTAPSYLPVSLEFAEFQVGEAVTAVQKKIGLLYKAPKR